MSILLRLAQIAKTLDHHGLHQEADQVTEVLVKVANLPVEPNDAYSNTMGMSAFDPEKAKQMAYWHGKVGPLVNGVSSGYAKGPQDVINFTIPDNVRTPEQFSAYMGQFMQANPQYAQGIANLTNTQLSQLIGRMGQVPSAQRREMMNYFSQMRNMQNMPVSPVQPTSTYPTVPLSNANIPQKPV